MEEHKVQVQGNNLPQRNKTEEQEDTIGYPPLASMCALTDMYTHTGIHIYNTYK